VKEKPGKILRKLSSNLGLRVLRVKIMRVNKQNPHPHWSHPFKKHVNWVEHVKVFWVGGVNHKQSVVYILSTHFELTWKTAPDLLEQEFKVFLVGLFEGEKKRSKKDLPQRKQAKRGIWNPFQGH